MDWIYHAMRYQERFERGFKDAPMSKMEIDLAVAEAKEQFPEIVKLVGRIFGNLK